MVYPTRVSGTRWVDHMNSIIAIENFLKGYEIFVTHLGQVKIILLYLTCTMKTDSLIKNGPPIVSVFFLSICFQVMLDSNTQNFKKIYFINVIVQICKVIKAQKKSEQ